VAKDQQLTVRVTSAEKEQIERKAENAGRSVSRFLVESALEEEMMSAEDREELVEQLGDLYEQVASIGGNVNQIAWRINSGQAIGSEAIERAAELAKEASKLVSRKMDEVR